jgi:hypothetical protein
MLLFLCNFLFVCQYSKLDLCSINTTAFSNFFSMLTSLVNKSMHFFASAPDLEDFNYKAKKTPPRSKNTPTKAKKRKGATPQNKKMGIAKGVVSSPYNIW